MNRTQVVDLHEAPSFQNDPGRMGGSVCTTLMELVRAVRNAIGERNPEVDGLVVSVVYSLLGGTGKPSPEDVIEVRKGEKRKGSRRSGTRTAVDDFRGPSRGCSSGIGQRQAAS